MGQKSILSARQKKLLALISAEKSIADDFYLGGGTALAEFYLHHRYSEDLDFFSEKEFDPRAISVFFGKTKNKIGIKKIDFQQSFNRNLFFLEFADETIKTEFTYYPFPRVEAGKTIGKMKIDSLLDIAVNKLFTIYQKPRARDFIDLYLINRQEKWNMGDLIKTAKIKFDWHIDLLQLGAQFLTARTVKDFPRMIIKIKNEEWQEYFVAEAKKLGAKILTTD